IVSGSYARVVMAFHDRLVGHSPRSLRRSQPNQVPRVRSQSRRSSLSCGTSDATLRRTKADAPGGAHEYTKFGEFWDSGISGILESPNPRIHLNAYPTVNFTDGLSIAPTLNSVKRPCRCWAPMRKLRPP